MKKGTKVSPQSSLSPTEIVSVGSPPRKEGVLTGRGSVCGGGISRLELGIGGRGRTVHFEGQPMGYYDDYDRYSEEPPRRRSRHDYDDDFDDSPYRRRSRYDDDDFGRSYKHSRFGIASVIIALCVGIFMFILIAIAGVLSMQAGGELDEDSPEAMMIGLGVLAGFAMNLISLGLAIAGLCEKRRNKVFAILGLVINVVLFIGVCGLTAIGKAMG
jgi:hypothetical protein